MVGAFDCCLVPRPCARVKRASGIARALCSFGPRGAIPVSPRPPVPDLGRREAPSRLRQWVQHPALALPPSRTRRLLPARATPSWEDAVHDQSPQPLSVAVIASETVPEPCLPYAVWQPTHVARPQPPHLQKDLSAVKVLIPREDLCQVRIAVVDVLTTENTGVHEL